VARWFHNSGVIFQGRAHYDAHFLFADGSIHLIESTTNIKTYWAPGSKVQGGVISSDIY
jgi:hypothetical protein